LLACIRRANLDTFWSRAKSSALSNRDKVVFAIKLSAMVGLQGPYKSDGALPETDHCSYEVPIKCCCIPIPLDPTQQSTPSLTRFGSFAPPTQTIATPLLNPTTSHWPSPVGLTVHALKRTHLSAHQQPSSGTESVVALGEDLCLVTPCQQPRSLMVQMKASDRTFPIPRYPASAAPPFRAPCAWGPLRCVPRTLRVT
jgi:hypothetical protein